MKHHDIVRLSHQFRLQVQEEVQSLVGVSIINVAGHQPERRVVIPLGLHQTAVKLRQLPVMFRQPVAQDLKFLQLRPSIRDATIRWSITCSFTPWRIARMRPVIHGLLWSEPHGHAPLLEQIQNKLEMLELLDRNSVERADVFLRRSVFLEIQRARRSLPLQMGVVNEHRRDVTDNFLKPTCRNLSRNNNT